MFATVAPATAAPTRAVPVTATTGQAIADHYIVTVSGASARSVAAAAHVTPRYVYDRVLNGFAGALNAGQLTALRHNPHVTRVEQDAVVRATDMVTQTPTPSWGLDRINQRSLPLDNRYIWNHSAAGVTAYIIDTGILVSHPDFGGRAAVAHDSLGGNGIDCNGHGTHVAGTVGGTAYGVAKSVALRAVRVLDCSGTGSIASVIDGMNWVASNHVYQSVANMSLGGPFSATENSAATALANARVAVAVAAGNSNADACSTSPASADMVTTVAASDINDNRASFSNYGSCVDIYAPGVNITSDWLANGTNTISGTSMATPHVLGAMAIRKSFLATSDPSSTTENSWVISAATPDVIVGNPTGTPNLLLFKANGA
jgi:hypothetical protein